MEPLPIKVKNVRVYPYIPDAPIEVPPVFESGAGTYSIGSLTTHLFYNLSLTNGTPRNGGAHAGVKYYAVYDSDSEKNQATPWMTCLQGGEQPRFGRTINALQPQPPAHSAADVEPQPNIAYRVHLSNIAVDMYVDPTEPLTIPLINGASGVATFVGLLPGGTWSVTAAGGRRVNPLNVGTSVTLTGTNVASGKPFHVPAVLQTRDAGDPALFVSALPR